MNQTYQEVWEDYWKEICTNEDGTINLDQVQRELSDYSFMLNEVPKVYSEVTGNTLSKPNYYANTVIGCFEDHVSEIVKSHVSDIIDDIECLFFDGFMSDNVLKEVIVHLQETYNLEVKSKKRKE